jgi:4a-hydroxytetrahydrobiopterin dehydratase
MLTVLRLNRSLVRKWPSTAFKHFKKVPKLSFTTKSFIDHVSGQTKTLLKDKSQSDNYDDDIKLISSINEGGPVIQKLTGKALEDTLINLKQKGWSPVKGRNAVTKTLQFRDFVDAFGFMSQVALVAEKMNHHPGNSYRAVSFVSA